MRKEKDTEQQGYAARTRTGYTTGIKATETAALYHTSIYGILQITGSIPAV